tara:strand:+ start:3710 stop:3883 length:174 start_codon:yes stop_codon:yes gene_type:complete
VSLLKKGKEMFDPHDEWTDPEWINEDFDDDYDVDDAPMTESMMQDMLGDMDEDGYFV